MHLAQSSHTSFMYGIQSDTDLSSPHCCIVPMHPLNDRANIMKPGLEVHQLIFKCDMLLLPTRNLKTLLGIELGYNPPELCNLAVVTVFFKLQLRCWPFLHNLQVGCYLLFQTANTLLVFATQLGTTLLSSFSRCNYVVGFRNTTCNYVPVFFFQLQHIATTLLAVVMQHATTLSSSFSNCNYVCNTTCNYVVIFFSNCNYVVGFSNTTCNYVVIFFFKLQLRF